LGEGDHEPVGGVAERGSKGACARWVGVNKAEGAIALVDKLLVCGEIDALQHCDVEGRRKDVQRLRPVHRATDAQTERRVGVFDDAVGGSRDGRAGRDGFGRAWTVGEQRLVGRRRRAGHTLRVDADDACIVPSTELQSDVVLGGDDTGKHERRAAVGDGDGVGDRVHVDIPFEVERSVADLEGNEIENDSGGGHGTRCG
jgi:hypothetical protein